MRITGYLSNQRVLEELLAARALVLPSFAEGLPGVFFEAMALGRPVISTYIAAHPELIESGVNGWLVPAGAVGPLVDAMAEVLATEPPTLEAMGRAVPSGWPSSTMSIPRLPSSSSFSSQRDPPAAGDR